MFAFGEPYCRRCQRMKRRRSRLQRVFLNLELDQNPGSVWFGVFWRVIPLYGTGFDLGQAFNPRNNCLDFDQIVAALAQAGKVFRRSAPASCLSERSREEGLLRSRSEYALAQELLDEVPCSPLLLRAGGCKPKLPSSCPFCPQGI